MATFHDPDDFCGAWAELARVMPEGWYFRSLQCMSGTSDRKRETLAVAKYGPHWRAQATRRHDLGLRSNGMLGIGATAAAALWQLGDYLTKVGPKGWSATFGDATFTQAPMKFVDGLSFFKAIDSEGGNPGD